MKRTVIAMTVTSLAIAGAGAASAKNGNGAQKAGLAAVSGNSLSGCKPASGTGSQTATGFVVLNAPGKPGTPKKIVGELAVKKAAPGTYDVRLAQSGCGDTVGTLVVGENGQGNASIAAAGKGAGSYYVTLTQQPVAGLPFTQQSYASAPVQLR